MANKDNNIWVSPCGRPACLCKQEVEKPSQNVAQPCAMVQGYVSDDLRAGGQCFEEYGMLQEAFTHLNLFYPTLFYLNWTLERVRCPVQLR